MRAASRLIQQKGLAATGLSEILREAEAPRGSLYFHFPGGKAQLAAEAVGLGGARITKGLAALLDATEEPGEIVELFFSGFAAGLEASNFTSGCPIATAALEATPSDQLTRDVCAQTFTTWTELLANKLAATGIPASQAAALSKTVLSAVEGAAILARVKRDTSVFEEVGKTLAELARSTPKR